jgi:hypothetical protein
VKKNSVTFLSHVNRFSILIFMLIE